MLSQDQIKILNDLAITHRYATFINIIDSQSLRKESHPGFALLASCLNDNKNAHALIKKILIAIAIGLSETESRHNNQCAIIAANLLDLTYLKNRENNSKNAYQLAIDSALNDFKQDIRCDRIKSKIDIFLHQMNAVTLRRILTMLTHDIQFMALHDNQYTISTMKI